MAGHGNRQQKKLAKKKARRAEKKVHLARQANAGLERLLRHAGDWPVVEALVPDNLWDSGIGHLILARQMPDGGVAYADYLVDVFCLGVKNVFTQIESAFGYRTFLAKVSEISQFTRTSPEAFAKLVTGAVEYARSIGFAPHPDYEEARLLLAGIDPTASPEQFEYGKDGAPHYIQGPSESPARAAAILARVQAAGGRFLVGSSIQSIGDFGFEPVDDDPDEPEAIGR